MGKTIIAVYQDCVLCGSKGRKKVAEYAKKGIVIRKVGFTTEEGKKLIHKAVFEHKIGSMPFYTDGEIFTTDLHDFVKNEEIPKEPKVRKRIKKLKNVKEKSDGNGAES